MNLRAHLFVGGGPIDGFRFVHESAMEWRYHSYTPPLGFKIYSPAEALKPLNIKIETYHRKGARLFIHESEV